MTHEDWTTADELEFVRGLGYHAPKRQWHESVDETRPARIVRLLRVYLGRARGYPIGVDVARVREAALERLRDFEQGV